VHGLPQQQCAGGGEVVGRFSGQLVSPRFRASVSVSLTLDSQKSPSLILLSGSAQHRRQAAFHICLGCGPRTNADAHCRLILPDCSATPAGAISPNVVNDPVRRFLVTEGDEHLVKHNLIENPVTCLSETFCKAGGMLARALDKVGHSLSAQHPQSSPYLNPPGTSG